MDHTDNPQYSSGEGCGQDCRADTGRVWSSEDHWLNEISLENGAQLATVRTMLYCELSDVKLTISFISLYL